MDDKIIIDAKDIKDEIFLNNYYVKIKSKYYLACCVSNNNMNEGMFRISYIFKKKNSKRRAFQFWKPKDIIDKVELIKVFDRG